MVIKYDPNRGKHIKWWHYLIAAVIIVLGLCFIYSGKIYTIEINKGEKVIKKTKQSLIPCHKTIA